MIKIFATTDIHGKLYPYDYRTMSESNSSICHIKTLIDSLSDDNSIIVDNGDLIQGNFVENFVDKYNPAVMCVNEIGYDIWNMGNHEFNFGEKNLLKNIAAFKNSALIANIDHPIMESYKIIEINDIKIAFIGIDTLMVNSFGNGLLNHPPIVDPVETLNELMPKIKPISDVIVGLFHVGMKDENSKLHTGVESILKDLKIPFDVIIAGHTHEEIEKKYIGETLITQPGAYAKSVSLVELEFSNKSLINKNSKLIQSKNFYPDIDLLEKLLPFHRNIYDNICRTIGYLENVEGDYDYDLEDGPLIHLFTNAISSYYPCDVVAFQFDFKNPVLKNGPLTLSELSKIYSYTGGEVTVYKITGEQLRKYINWSYRYFSLVNGYVEISKRRVRFKYKTLDIFGNIQYTIDLNKEDVVCDLKYASGQPILDSDFLTIGMNQYRMNYLTCDRGPLKNTFAQKIISSTETKNNGKFGTIRELVEQYLKSLPNETFVYNETKLFKVLQKKKTMEI
ncbi:MAG: bifunctional UDP-sugar hydrolase/5'-nucleotidase [Peptoniphilus sp.]|uniref:bifunctional metallophosphatase/5'-nucleotidase n=1 Tax=Peptoniphilus sp. TaxID=1971214 RepID=UPI002A76360D|nr:bifunctional UDP-sugar hydrolase/5'-nucleotidase [Peptoniphilus sp.]MDY2986646.1 bifunctional UDP-sugar hydrolase/5'-nucleotidase [Peptoniphilus sp.]